MWKWLDNKKTKLGVIGIGLTILAHGLDLIDTKTAEYVLAGLATWTGYSVRLAIGKVQK